MKIRFYTLGCKVNQYETQALMEDFSSRGMEVTSGSADLCVINTCTVTAKADSKSREVILRAKKDNPGAKIAVSGCLAQLDQDYIRSIGADYIVPQSRKKELAALIMRDLYKSPSEDRFLDKNSLNDGEESLKINSFFNCRAFVKIQDGCDNACSFCKIPHIRGRSLSRPKDEIISEIKRLCPEHKEIAICGINLGLYGKDLRKKTSLAELAGEIIDLDCLGRLRLGSIEPYLVTDELISLFKRDKVCPHAHLCLQSCDDKVLAGMNKKETVSLYRDIVNRLRAVNPDIAITCDIIVGFPVEEAGNFENTLEELEYIRPMRTHIFKFSPRQGTMLEKATVRNRNEVYGRYRRLKELTDGFALEYKNKFIGRKLHAAAEEKINGFVSGYSENYIKVFFKGRQEDLGGIYPVIIEKVEEGRVLGRVI